MGGVTQPACTLAVVGVGLIGGSFAAALRAQGLTARILGVGRNAASLEQARVLGLIDEVVGLEQAAARADLIFLAVPVGSMQQALTVMAPHLRDSTVLTDAGSTKSDVVAAARAALGDRVGQFVPGHPIAGAAATGPQAAHASLYAGKQVVLTPLPENTPECIGQVQRAWQACGARLHTMTPAAHDRALGSVSHLPHLLAAVYMAQVAATPDATDRLALAGTGFRDFTRIAAGSPEMWHDIFLANAHAVRAELADVRALLDQMDRALAQGDGASLTSLLQYAAEARRAWQTARETSS